MRIQWNSHKSVSRKSNKATKAQCIFACYIHTHTSTIPSILLHHLNFCKIIAIIIIFFLLLFADRAYIILLSLILFDLFFIHFSRADNYILSQSYTILDLTPRKNNIRMPVPYWSNMLYRCSTVEIAPYLDLTRYVCIAL